MNISYIIRELLLRNEQLVIPGFGAFRIISRPARISRSTQELLPPAREIVFDNNHKNEDTQLLTAIRKKGGITELEAMEALKSFIIQLQAGLHEGSVELEGLGQLQSDKKGAFTFKPVDDLLNFSGILALPKLELETTAPARKEASEPPVQEKRMTPRKRRWWPAAAILVLLVAGGATAYLSGWLSTGKTSEKEPVVPAKADSNRLVFGSRPAHDSLTEVINRKLEEETSRDALRPVEPDNKATAVPETGSAAVDVKTPEVATSSGPYHIITGAFSVPGNAEKQLADLKAMGFNPTLLPKRGKFYMVSLGSYASHPEASKALGDFKREIDVELWIKKIQ